MPELPWAANAEEAKAAYSRREFACKNNVVLKEDRESRFWLRLIVATGLTPEGYEQTSDALRQEADELVGIYRLRSGTRERR